MPNFLQMKRNASTPDLKKLFILWTGLICSALTVFGQTTASELDYSLRIRKAQSPIKLDGMLDEPAWMNADSTGDFYLNAPFDTSFASLQTKVRVTFDDKFIYVAAICMQPRSSYTIQSLKRDFGPGTTDLVIVNIDPFQDKLNGFHFAVSPMNVQREGLIDNGANLTTFWDNKWYSAVHQEPDRWVAEIAIPFTTLRYKLSEGQNTWNINFIRNILHNNESSTWKPVPRNFRPNNLAFFGNLIWEEAPPKPGKNIVGAPYLTGSFSQEQLRSDDYTIHRGDSSVWTGGAGLDAKIGITPSLNLDLTINPDFSQVEVDQQVTNLTRFELFFPERRQFFLENSDLFGFFGFPGARPFFSRRIGIVTDPATGLTSRVPIVAGARLSGRLNENWRVGLMNMQTQKDKELDLPASNYTVAVAQRKLLERSTIGGIFVNKESFLADLSPEQQGNFERFNRVGGLEFNYYSADNKWENETYYHRSFSPDPDKQGSSLAFFNGYSSTWLDAKLGFHRIDDNYTAETGFVPRTGFQGTFHQFDFLFNPKNKLAEKVVVYGFGTRGETNFSLKGSQLDHDWAFYGFLNFRDQTEGFTGFYHSYIQLTDPFDPTNSGKEESSNYKYLEAGSAYTNVGWFLGFNSSPRHDFRIESEVNAGQFFNGHFFATNTVLSYRVQPIGLLSVGINYNNINLPAPYPSGNVWLIGPRAELSFSRSVFFSTFFQYNTQANNFNINSRFQWRFRPVSDLFLVYTDNYFAEGLPLTPVKTFSPKNRSLVLKITYWLNV